MGAAGGAVEAAMAVATVKVVEVAEMEQVAPSNKSARPVGDLGGDEDDLDGDEEDDDEDDVEEDDDEDVEEEAGDDTGGIMVPDEPRPISVFAHY